MEKNIWKNVINLLYLKRLDLLNNIVKNLLFCIIYITKKNSKKLSLASNLNLGQNNKFC